MQASKILLGITGGIAAYKTPELVRLLTTRGHEVCVILTDGSKHFVTETTLTALTSRRVRSDLWDLDAERTMGHIELAKWADVLLIAPATAKFIAKMVHGQSDDLLSTVYLATNAPVMVAPAMNQAMWAHPAQQRNIQQLKDDGVIIVGPVHGDQACGDVGLGRMCEPQAIVECIEDVLNPWPQTLKGVNVVVTAGPTQESIDPVRYLSNWSSGKQGFAIAHAALSAGATVTLISGPVQLNADPRIKRIDVSSAAEMSEAVQDVLPLCDIFFSVAAVADYRPKTMSDQKIKHNTESANSGWTLELIENEDIVSLVSHSDPKPFVVGFAAETDNLIVNAREKLQRKKLDAIIANNVANQKIGFKSDENEVTVIMLDSETTLPQAPKEAIARQVIEMVSAAFQDSTNRAT